MSAEATEMVAPVSAMTVGLKVVDSVPSPADNSQEMMGDHAVDAMYIIL